VTYRSLEAVHQERAEELRLEINVLERELHDLEHKIDDAERGAKALDEKVAREGPGGGGKGASLLRIPFMVGWLLFIGVLLIPFEAYIGSYVHRDPHETIIPILILNGPGILGMVVAWPFRRVETTYKGGVLGGLLLVAINLTIIALGMKGILK
jgi:hypothetical protein